MSVRRETMTGLERARQRRRHRSIAVMMVAAVLVFGGFGLALAYVQGWVGATPSEPSCTPTTTVPPQAKFTVNVYNSSGRSGAAGDMSRSLRTRGFSLGSVGNDPYKKKLRGAGEIRYGSAGEDLAKRYVVTLLPDAKLVPDGRNGTTVDVAIGQEMKIVPTAAETTDSGGC